VHIRLPEDMLAAIDELAATGGVSRSEAIRRLVELALKARGK
jgi:metal-responsive CopG/Arc/MetJ family transcriptional regulator